MAGALGFDKSLSPENILPFPKRFGQATEEIFGQNNAVRFHKIENKPQAHTIGEPVIYTMLGFAIAVHAPIKKELNIEWLKPLFQTTSELLTLPKNWDSYGSNPINPMAISNAVNLILLVINQNIPKPSIVPTSGGNVQLEWHTRGIDLEVEVKSNNKFYLSFEDNKNNEIFEDEFDLSNVTLFIKAISKLAQRA